MKVAYSTKATTSGGRDGRAATADGTLEVRLSTPKELGGGGGDGTNPEQLFAAGYSACFLSAIKHVAAQEKIKVPDDAKVTATVGVGERDDGQGFGLDVELAVSLPGIERDKAQELAEKAHVVCPYSHATKGNVDVRLAVE